MLRRRGTLLIAAFALTLASCSGGRGATDTDAGAGVTPAPPVGPAGTDDPGPWRTEGGVPVGYAPTREGAVAAATSYLATIHRLITLGPEAREDALRRIAAPGALATVRDTLEGLGAFDAMLAQARTLLPGARLYVREVPVAYDVAAFSDQRATVAIWSFGIVLVEGLTEATEAWSTNTVELVWEDGDWRVWSWSAVAGPTPARAAEEVSSPAEVLDAVGAWPGFRYVPAG